MHHSFRRMPLIFCNTCKMKILKFIISGCLLLIVFSCKSNLNILEELSLIENIASPKEDWEGIMFSSYDRNGGNDDGFAGTFSKLRLEKGNSVLAECNGPGYISRIWFTHSSLDVDGLLARKKEHIKIYLDDKETPLIDIPLENLFQGTEEGFPNGLVGKGLGGYYCYVPISFNNYCRVEVEGDDVKFYQVNVQMYKGNKKIKTLSQKNLVDTNKLLKDFGEMIHEHMGGNKEALKEFIINVPANEVGSLEIEKDLGIINELNIEVAPNNLESLLKCQLKIYWDDHKSPSVDVPLKMFFTIPNKDNPSLSLFSGYKNGKLYNTLPMPFNKKARIEIISNDQELMLKVGCLIRDQNKETPRVLSTYYNENLPTKNKDKPHLLLDTKGEGHYVGTFLITEGKTHEKHLPVWLEGDEVFEIDGEIKIHGTGTEDYFNCGWYGVEGRLNNSENFPLHGFPEYRMDITGKASAYRWHLLDPIPFKSSIHATIEHGTNNSIEADYRSVAFYYINQ